MRIRVRKSSILQMFLIVSINFFIVEVLERYRFSATCFDGSCGRFRKSIRFNFHFGRKRPVAQNFYQIVARYETGCTEVFQCDFLQLLGFCNFLDCIKPDRHILYTIDILETEFRQTALQRHLTAFETDLFLIARTLLGTFVAAR